MFVACLYSSEYGQAFSMVHFKKIGRNALTEKMRDAQSILERMLYSANHVLAAGLS